MQDGICPKCGSHEVYSNYSHQKNPQVETTTVKIGQFTEPVSFADTYVCLDCGYTESYVTDPNRLKDIAGSWIKVGSS